MTYLFLFILFACCFILGMVWMRIGLFNLSGSVIERGLRKMTGTPLKGLAAGIVMTGLLQSSSAVTVIAVGLVSARILTFPQTIGIILGTNIGSTIMLEVFTFDLSQIILPALAIGLLLQLFRSSVMWRSIGFIFLGIGIIFASMNGFEWLSEPLAGVGYVQRFIAAMGASKALALLTGTFLTAIIQSSTVMTGIAMSFLASGTIELGTGIAIMFGANIGTCSTALFASLGAGREARLTAFAHLWLNLGGVALFWFLIPSLATLSAGLSPLPETQLAHASVLFNVACSLLVLPFAGPFGRMIEKLHGERKR